MLAAMPAVQLPVIISLDIHGCNTAAAAAAAVEAQLLQQAAD
jgi:hypothetical protein